MKHYIWVCIWALIILAGSLTPGSAFPDVTWESLLQADKIIHFVFYFVFSWLLLYGISKNKPSINSWLLLTFILASSYGIIIEVIQGLWVPKRNFDYFDIIANIIGALTAVLLFKKLKK